MQYIYNFELILNKNLKLFNILTNLVYLNLHLAIPKNIKK